MVNKSGNIHLGLYLTYNLISFTMTKTPQGFEEDSKSGD